MNQRNNWGFDTLECEIDKGELVRINLANMLNRTITMFKYTNLPPTIKQKDLEFILQTTGFCIWKKIDKEVGRWSEGLYVFSGGLGGEPNPYYLPSIAIIANPALKYSATLKIDEECVVMLNDNLYRGLMPTHRKYANLLTDAEISLRYALINQRVPALISADNDISQQSAEEFFSKIVTGDDFGIVATSEFFDGIKTHDFSKYSNIKDVIEAIQYIKGSWFNEFGLNAQFNMKREAINESEALLNEDILIPTVDSMLKQRQIALEKVNKMFGTNITVELDSVWEKNRIVDELEVNKLESEVVEDENES